MKAAMRGLLEDGPPALASGLARVRRREGLIGAALFDSAGGFIARVALTGVNFVLMVALLRLLGRSDFGVFSFAVATLGLAMFPAMLGYDGYLIQKIGAFLAESRLDLATLYIRRVLAITAVVSLLSAIGTATVSLLAPIFDDATTRNAIALVALSLPLTVAQKILCSVLVATGRRLTAFFLDELLSSCLMLFAIVALWLADPASIDITVVLLARAAAVGVGVLAGLVLLSQRIPLFRRGQGSAENAWPNLREWRRKVFPFMLNSTIAIWQSSMGCFLLGTLASPDAVGQFQPAQRLVGLLSFAMMATNLVIQPTIARYHAQRRVVDLQRLVAVTSRASFAFSSALAALLFLAADPILHAMSRELASSVGALRILLVGTWLATAAPAGATILLMSGRQDIAATLMLRGLFGSGLLNILLVPPMGVEGAALATAMTTAGLHATLWFYARRSTGLDASIIGRARSLARSARDVEGAIS